MAVDFWINNLDDHITRGHQSQVTQAWRECSTDDYPFGAMPSDLSVCVALGTSIALVDAPRGFPAPKAMHLEGESAWFA
jgi:hypothetical protein